MKRIAEKDREIRSTLLFCFLIAIVFALVGGYVITSRPSPAAVAAPQASTQQTATANAQPSTATQAATPAQLTSALPQSKESEIQDAVKRVYKDTVVADTSRVFYGDFNGDDSPDLAIVAKPKAGMLPKINDELAMWELEDPHLIVAPTLSKRVRILPRKSKPVQASQSDLLLIVIHGNGTAGWRDPKANGTYLLKNSVGGEMNTQPRQQALGTIKGSEDAPSLRGDVIRAMLAGKPGFLFWTGGAYSWYELS
ncbi:MAG: hypothetical protein WBP93_13375 [Pyrinomonadaceae bacterium]